MTKRVAINGFGRVGRSVLKIIHETPGLELVAINDIAAPDNLAYLVRYDTVYGRFGTDVRSEGDTLIIDDARYRLLAEKDPSALPWREMGVDLVFECTGVFTRREELEKHLQAGARQVVLSAPAKGEDVPFVVMAPTRPRANPSSRARAAPRTASRR
jgi:glyceraldehyde 3-phosphate dehydrogenase